MLKYIIFKQGIKMTSEIIKFHNDLNKIAIGKLNALEQDLLFKILSNLKNYQEINNNSIWLPIWEFRDLDKNYRLSNTEFYALLKSLKEKFFKLDFTIITNEIKEIQGQKRKVIAEKTTNLFNQMTIYYEQDQADYLFNITSFIGVELEINPQFKYLIYELSKYYTEFELQEFFTLTSKYAKTLYRLLKQFRKTGKLSTFKNDWQGFCEIMDIPKSYQMCNIDQRILKPAIAELTAEPNLFTNEKQTIFKNLTYKKIKDPKGKGRGGKVIGIEFYFTPEPKRNEFKEMIQNLARTEKEMEKNSGREPKIHIITGEEVTELDGYKDHHFRINNKEFGGYDTCKITDLKYIEHEGKKQIWALMLNQENHSAFEMFFDSIAHMKNALKLN